MKAMNLSKLRGLAIALMAVLFVGSASAEILYITLSGNIAEMDDRAGLIDDAGLALGDPVEYVIAVDMGAEGQKINDDGSVWTLNDYEVLHDTYYKKVDSFFSDLIGKGYLDTTDPAPGPAEQQLGQHVYLDYYEGDAQDVNWIYLSTDRPFRGGQLVFHRDVSPDLSVTLEEFFALGATWRGTEQAEDIYAPDPSSDLSWFRCELVVTEVSVDPPMLDTDGDGVFDSEDACPGSDLSRTVVFNSCDSTVPNYLLSNGCTVSDLVNECYEFGTGKNGRNQCFSSTVNDLYKNLEVIDRAEWQLLKSCR